MYIVGPFRQNRLTKLLSSSASTRALSTASASTSRDSHLNHFFNLQKRGVLVQVYPTRTIYWCGHLVHAIPFAVIAILGHTRLLRYYAFAAEWYSLHSLLDTYEHTPYSASFETAKQSTKQSTNLQIWTIVDRYIHAFSRFRGEIRTCACSFSPE